MFRRFLLVFGLMLPSFAFACIYCDEYDADFGCCCIVAKFLGADSFTPWSSPSPAVVTKSKKFMDVGTAQFGSYSTTVSCRSGGEQRLTCRYTNQAGTVVTKSYSFGATQTGN